MKKFHHGTQRFGFFTSNINMNRQKVQMNVKSLVLLCVFVAGAFCACSKDNVAERWAKEEAELAEWIAQNKPGLIIENGIYFEKLLPEYDENIRPDANDFVLVDYECRFLSNNVLEKVSYKDWQARGASIPSVFREGGPELWESKFWEVMGVGHLRENESANVYIPSRLLNLQDFETRVFTIHLRKVIDENLKVYQEKLMECYMKKYEKVDTITIKEDGKDFYVIYHVEREGAGNAITGSSVKTRTSESYYLQSGDEKICFSNRDFSWTKHLAMFRSENQPVKRGGRIIAVMPYRLMYGAKANMENKQYIAPTNSVLKYEINID